VIIKPKPKKLINPFLSFEELEKKVKAEVHDQPSNPTDSLAAEMPQKSQPMPSTSTIRTSSEIPAEIKNIEITAKMEPLKPSAEIVTKTEPIENVHFEPLNAHFSEINVHLKDTLVEKSVDLKGTFTKKNVHLKSENLPINVHSNVTSECTFINAHDKSTRVHLKNKLVDLGIVQEKQPSKEPLIRHDTKIAGVLRILINQTLEQNKTVAIDDSGIKYKLTGPIDISDLADKLASVPQSIRNITATIEDRFGMRRVYVEYGRNGYIIFGFPEDSFGNLIKLINNVNGNAHEKCTRQTELNSTLLAPSKLVSNINTKLTNTSELTPDEIDLSAIIKFGITKKHLNDLKNQQLPLTNMMVQDFVKKFAIYASNPTNIRNVGNLPGLFCKMAQSVAKGEDPLSDIETEEDRVINERIEVLKRKKEEKERKEAELINLEFQDWLGGFNQEEILDLVPDARIVSKIETRINIIKQYFVENIWKPPTPTL
jgi:hypothetical protein